MQVKNTTIPSDYNATTINGVMVMATKTIDLTTPNEVKPTEEKEHTNMKTVRIKKATLDLAIEWVREHNCDFYNQFTAYEWHIAELVSNFMAMGIKYNKAKRLAYQHYNDEGYTDMNQL